MVKQKKFCQFESTYQMTTLKSSTMTGFFWSLTQESTTPVPYRNFQKKINKEIIKKKISANLKVPIK